MNGLAKTARPSLNLRSLAVFATVAVGLAGCQDKHEWHQKLTVVVDTPSGKVSGSSVIAIEATFGQAPMSDREVWYRVTGEATAVEIAPGRYLFALLGGSEERYYRTVRDRLKNVSRGEWLKRIPLMKEVVTLQPDSYPKLITFVDIDSPGSAREVSANTVFEVFGAGYKLDRVTIEITDDPVTNGAISALLPWINNPTVMDNPGWSRLPLVSRNAIGGLLSQFPD